MHHSAICHRTIHSNSKRQQWNNYLPPNICDVVFPEHTPVLSPVLPHPDPIPQSLLLCPWCQEQSASLHWALEHEIHHWLILWIFIQSNITILRVENQGRRLNREPLSEARPLVRLPQCKVPLSKRHVLSHVVQPQNRTGSLRYKAHRNRW